MNPIKAHGGKGSWPFSFERSPPLLTKQLMSWQIYFHPWQTGGSVVKLPHIEWYLLQQAEIRHSLDFLALRFAFLNLDVQHLPSNFLLRAYAEFFLNQEFQVYLPSLITCCLGPNYSNRIKLKECTLLTKTMDKKVMLFELFISLQITNFNQGRPLPPPPLKKQQQNLLWDIWQCLEKFLVVTTWERGVAKGIQQGEAKNIAKPHTLKMIAPHNQELSDPNVSSAETQKLWLRARQIRKCIFLFPLG